MKNYRNRFSIIFDILTIIITNKGPMEKTRLMYKTLTSYNQINDYLKFLNSKKIISIEEDKSVNITALGLEIYEKMAELKEYIMEPLVKDKKEVIMRKIVEKKK